MFLHPLNVRILVNEVRHPAPIPRQSRADPAPIPPASVDGSAHLAHSPHTREAGSGVGGMGVGGMGVGPHRLNSRGRGQFGSYERLPPKLKAPIIESEPCTSSTTLPPLSSLPSRSTNPSLACLPAS